MEWAWWRQYARPQCCCCLWVPGALGGLCAMVGEVGCVVPEGSRSRRERSERGPLQPEVQQSRVAEDFHPVAVRREPPVEDPQDVRHRAA